MATTAFTWPVEAVVPVVVGPTVVMIPKISIIMPVYNAQRNVAKCIKSTNAHLNKLGNPYEIIVVDDGSTDNTRAEAMSVQGNPHVNVVGYQQNRGKGFAIKHGSKFVTGDVVIFMDGDADVKPELTRQYVTILENHDIAIASKCHPDSRVSAPIMRKLLSRTFHCLVMLLTGVRVSDTQSGFKAFRREALGTVIGLLSVKRYAFDVELLTVANLLKLRIVELPVRIDLDSYFSVRDILRMLVDLMGITYRLRVIHWYQRNLHNSRADYKPMLSW